MQSLLCDESKGKDYEFKRNLLDSLSKDTIPSNITDLLDFAREAAINEEKIRLFVKENVRVLRNSAYIVNTNNSISKAQSMQPPTARGKWELQPSIERERGL